MKLRRKYYKEKKDVFKETMALCEFLEGGNIEWTPEKLKEFSQRFESLIRYILRRSITPKDLFDVIPSSQNNPEASAAEITESLLGDLNYFSDRFSANRAIRATIQLRDLQKELAIEFNPQMKLERDMRRSKNYHDIDGKKIELGMTVSFPDEEGEDGKSEGAIVDYGHEWVIEGKNKAGGFVLSLVRHLILQDKGKQEIRVVS